jgi:hypothetical protein
MAPTLITALIEVLLCLPTAPVLLLGGSGDFGTSPFFEQLSDKPQLARKCLRGLSDAKHNSGSRN